MLVDAPGNPLKLLLTSAAAGDKPPAALADRGDAADAPLAALTDQWQARATLPPKHNLVAPRACAEAADQERQPVECCLGKRTHGRRLCSRFAQYATRFLAFSHAVGLLIWLNKARLWPCGTTAQPGWCLGKPMAVRDCCLSGVRAELQQAQRCSQHHLRAGVSARLAHSAGRSPRANVELTA